jgi:hypothetical protein
MVYEQAKPAYTFVDSVGVVTHVRYNNIYQDFNLVKSTLLDLGVKHIRDEVAETGNKPTVISRLQDLGRSGIKVTLVSNPWVGNTPTKTQETALQLKASLAAVEGPNEWNERNTTVYQGQTFPKAVALYQTQLYNAIKGAPGIATVPVIAPSTYYREQANSLAANPFPCDYGNTHSYPGGKVPSESRLESSYLPWARSTCVGKPVMATETGYHYAVNDLTIDNNHVSEVAGGRYISRLVFDYFNRGIHRTFLYELFDEGTDPKNKETQFGLVRNDKVKKPAFTTLKNILAILKEPDSNAAFVPKSLSYEISGPSSIKRTLLQKRNGTFYLILWDDVVSYNPVTKVTTNTVPKNIGIRFSPRFKTVSIYRPNESAAASLNLASPAQVNVAVPDQALILELKP